MPVGVQGDDELSHKQKEGDYCQLLPNCKNTRCRATHTFTDTSDKLLHMSIPQWQLHQHTAHNVLHSFVYRVTYGNKCNGIHCKRHWKFKMFTWIWRFKIESCLISFICAIRINIFCKHGISISKSVAFSGAKKNKKKLSYCLNLWHFTNQIAIFILWFFFLHFTIWFIPFLYSLNAIFIIWRVYHWLLPYNC